MIISYYKGSYLDNINKNFIKNKIFNQNYNLPDLNIDIKSKNPANPAPK